MDLFSRIKTLAENGVDLTLHVFDYGRGKKNELLQYCKEVFYYERHTGFKSFSFRTPYIIRSRANEDLLKNLLADEAPVLLEGIHCTAFLHPLRKAGKKVAVRAHNVEATYYKQLSRCERSLFKKIYFLFESRLLRKYEAALPEDLPVFCLSATDADYFRNEYGKKNVYLMPAFIPCQEITATEGMGSFCLYHGNLGVTENEKSAAWLLQNVFTKIKVPFVVAGKNPSRRLEKLAHLCQHTCIVSNPSEKELNELIHKAHINIIPSFNKTGVKLKLVMAICKGKHCLVNDDALAGSGLEDACHVGNTSDAMASIIAQLYHMPFAEEEIVLRKKIIRDKFDNTKNAALLIQHLW